MMMTSEEYRLAFTLLDDHGRRNGCFVSEFFFSSEQYSICLRPVGGERDDPDRYAGKYLQVSVEDVRAITSQGALRITMVDAMDDALLALRCRC